MPRNQRSNQGRLPNAGAVLQAQFDAAENVTRVAGTACNYAISMNRTWLNLWSNQLSQMAELPRRIASVQREMAEETLDDFQESMQQLGEITMQAKDEAEGSIRETADDADQMARQSRPQPSSGNGGRERRTENHKGADRRKGERQQAR